MACAIAITEYAVTEMALSWLLIMAALRSRCGHYIFVLFLLLFFPRLVSAVGDWMSATLPHMVWP